MPSLSYESASLSVLIVDDEVSILVFLASMLRHDGHTIGLAADGHDAMCQFVEKRWDLVITDRAMPGMNGETLALKIKALSPHTPVIMVTGMIPPGGCPGVDAIVGKPFQRAAIVESITRCLAIAAPEAPPPPAGFSAAV